MKQLLLALLFFPVFAQGQTLAINFDTTGNFPLYIYAMQWQDYITIDTLHYSHNAWQVGRPQKAVFDTAYSYRKVIVTDTAIPCPPNDTSVFILTFKGYVSLGSCGVGGVVSNMSFYYQLDMDTTSIAMIEFSSDSGHTWVNVYDTAIAHYFDTVTPLANTTIWNYWSIGSLGPIMALFSNDSIMFRFTYISSSDTSLHPGWMIDDIDIQYICGEKTELINTSSNISLFPNPAQDELSVQSTGVPINSIVITNMYGQTIYSLQTVNREQQTIYVANLPPGIYLVRVNDTEVRKFVKD